MLHNLNYDVKLINLATQIAKHVIVQYLNIIKKQQDFPWHAIWQYHGGISRILRLMYRQRWAEDGMQKCEVIFAQALSLVEITKIQPLHNKKPFFFTFNQACMILFE